MATFEKRALSVYMNSHLVGYWRITTYGEQQFSYASQWIANQNSRPISFSLPLIPATERHSGSAVASFFENLLPDAQNIRERLQTRFRTPTSNAFDLLSIIGRDCLGAIQLIPVGEEHILSKQPFSGTVVNDSEIAQILREVPLSRSSLRSLKDFRISIAGAQEKTTFSKMDDSWYIPEGTTPSTHIFKLPIGHIGFADLSDSLENEYLCSKIVSAYGIPIADTRIEQFEDQKVLIVTRFDRKWDSSGKHLLRIPHEDLCQATGTPPAFKYESDGGPGIRQIMDILLSSEDANENRLRFLKSLMINWLLAAPDAHAKNFSIQLKAGEQFSLAPLYDVTSAYPYLDRKGSSFNSRKLRMAMKTEYYQWDKILPRHWVRTAKDCGIAEDTTMQILSDLTSKTDAVIERCAQGLPEGFPSYVADAIFEGLHAQAEKTRRMM